MNEHHIPDGLMHEAYQLFEGGHTSDEVMARFIARGYQEEQVNDLVQTVKGIRLKKRRSRGVVYAGIGAVTLVMAFVMTYTLHHFQINTDMALYGLTTLGITLLFIGMIQFMG
jgi:hypothetical protein